MATVKIDNNIDQIVKIFATMETKVGTSVIREARKNMKSTMKKQEHKYRKITPEKTGILSNFMRVKSQSRRGRTSTRIVWEVPYAPFVNFKKKQSGEKFVLDEFEKNKVSLEAEGKEDVVGAFIKVLTDVGFKVIR